MHKYPNSTKVNTLVLLVVIFVFQSAWSDANAQISPLSDQYLINPFLSNPAIAGTERYMPLRITTRQQWIGINNGPATQAVSLHKRFRAKNIRFTPRGFINKGKNSFGKVGVGGSVFNYSYGPIKHTGISLAYAYHVFVGRGRLAFGLSPMAFQYSINKTGLTLPDADVVDEAISNDPFESLIFLDASAGMHYYDESMYAGLSVIQLLNSSVVFGDLSYNSEDNMSQNPDLARSVYAYWGSFFDVTRDIQLEPSVWLRYNEQKGTGFDVNAIFHIREMFQAGLSFRYKQGAGLIAGVTLDNLKIRYLFEAPFTADIPARYTTHQIMVNFNLGEPID